VPPARQAPHECTPRYVLVAFLHLAR
jgi:hypothetical protein